MVKSENGWSKYELKVLSDLEELKEDTKVLRDRFEKLDKIVFGLKVRFSVYSVIGGAIVSLVFNYLLK